MSEIYKVSAKTVDEAMDLAEKLYGGAKKELSYDIESLPKKGFLGIGAKDAVIRVTVSAVEDEMKPEKKQSSAKSEKPATRAQQKVDSTPAPKAQSAKSAKPAAKSDSAKPSAAKADTAKAEPAKTDAAKTEPARSEGAKDSSPAKEKKNAPAKNTAKSDSRPAKAQNKPAAKSEQPVKNEQSAKSRPAKDAESEKKRAVSREEMDFAKSFISSVIAEMHLDAAVEEIAAPEGEEYITGEGFDVYPAVNIVGEDTGALIGHHGETLDALQYLVNLALYRNAASSGKTRENIKITVDIANYRAKREETLRALAVRMANRAVKYKKNVFLEPMNPYERRIIHSELQDFPNVATHSVGSDVNRKIIITYEGADRQMQNKRRRNDRRTQQHAAPESDKPLADIPAAKSESASIADTPVAMPLPTLDDIDA